MAGIIGVARKWHQGPPKHLDSHYDIALSDNFQGRAAKIWFGCVDSSMNIIANPLLIFSGEMDTCKIDDNGQNSTITITAENSLVDLENPRERRFTDADQQLQFPGDLGLQYVGAIQNIDINWGIPNAPSASIPNGNGGRGPGNILG